VSTHTFASTASERSGIEVNRGLNVGIIGLGFIGEVHTRAIRAAGSTVQAVSAFSLGEARAAAAKAGIPRALATEELMADKDIEVIHICTPNIYHAELTEMALRNGKHVICEKPLATSFADAKRLTQIAEESGLVATVPFVYRYYPALREARSRIAASGKSPDLIHGYYLQDWLAAESADNWRVDPKLGGPSRAFGDIGVHWCDLIEFVSGEKIARVNAQFLKVFENRGQTKSVSTEDGATIIFETQGGAKGSLVLSQVSAGRKNKLWFSIEGPQYSFVFDQENPDSLWQGGIASNQMHLRGSQGESVEASRLSYLPAGHPQGYQDCFNAFIADTYAAIGGAKIEGLPLFVDGLRATQLTEAVLRSAEIRDWVEIV